MSLEWEVPENSDFWPCPEGCGGGTEDEAGGPCRACWRDILARDRAERSAEQYRRPR